MMRPVVAVLVLCALSFAQQSTSSREASAVPQGQGSESGQKSIPDKKVSEALAPKPLPLYDVVLSPNPDVSTILPDRTEVVAEGCDGSGNPYFSVGHDVQVFGLTSRGLVSFNARKVTDISSLTFVKAYVAPSELYVLAIWVDPAKSAQKDKESDPIRDFIEKGEGEERFYIVRFALDGSYKGAVKLEFEFLPIQFAAFDNGSFLIGGLDKSRGAHVGLLNSSGQLLNYLRLPKDVAENPEAARKSFAAFGMGDDVPPELIAVFASATSYRGNVLFRRASDFSRMYEIRNTGEVRLVNVKDARASSFDDMLQSDENWFAYAKQDELYEISSSTGKLLGHYRLKSKIEQKDQVAVYEGQFIGTRYAKGSKIEQKDQLACVYQGKFIGIRQTKGKLTLLTGVAEPAGQEPAPATDQR